MNIRNPLVVSKSTNPKKGAPSFSLKHRIYRSLFMVVWAFFASWTPRQFMPIRRFILNVFGANVHRSAQIYGSAKIWFPGNLQVGAFSTIGPNVNVYSMGEITIGQHVIISQGANLCTGSHDIKSADFQIYAREIVILDEAWVCAEAFVGPGVTIGAGAVLAARGAAFNDLDSWSVYRGNPAVKIKAREVFSRDP